jgi:glycine hydroxymethyltransferase
MRQIAGKADAVFMVDTTHFANLIADQVFTGDYDPVLHLHVVTTTTYKILRNPQGGLVLSTNALLKL